MTWVPRFLLGVWCDLNTPKDSSDARDRLPFTGNCLTTADPFRPGPRGNPQGHEQGQEARIFPPRCSHGTNVPPKKREVKGIRAGAALQAHDDFASWRPPTHDCKFS